MHFHSVETFSVGAAVPRAEQREAGEPRGERQAEDDQRGAVPRSGEHQSGAGSGSGSAEHAAGAGGQTAAGERDVGITHTHTHLSWANF